MAGINGWQSFGGTYLQGNKRACEQCKTCSAYWIDDSDHRCMVLSDSAASHLANGNMVSNCSQYRKGKPKQGKPDYGKTKMKLGPCSPCRALSSCFQKICSCLRCCGVRGNILGWDV